MPNGPPGLTCTSGRPTGEEDAVTPSQYSRVPAQPPAPANTNDSLRVFLRVFAAESRKPLRQVSGFSRSFAHYEENSPLVAEARDIRGTMVERPSPTASSVSRWWRAGMSISSVSAAVAVCLDVVEPPHLYFQLAPGSAPPGQQPGGLRGPSRLLHKGDCRMTSPRIGRASCRA